MIRAAPCLLALAGCAAERPAALPARPLRVVSLDYCADQYVLELLPRDRIAALSPDAAKAFSYHRSRAAGLKQVASRAEDVLLLKPDLVIRSYGGGPEAAHFFAQAGIPVLQISYADDLPAVRRTLIEVASGLGERAAGERLARDMDRRLAQLPTGQKADRVLYMTPGGVTSGSGTLIDAMIRAAGRANFQREPGWRPLPLERLATDRPELIGMARFGAGRDRPDQWSAARHPVARAQLSERPVVALEGAWTSCGGWFVLDAVEALARGRS